MSLEAVAAFRSALAQDVALQKLCAEAIAARDAQGLAGIAASRGFDFTAAELEESVGDGELSDSELELVAGGVVIPPRFDKSAGSHFGR